MVDCRVDWLTEGLDYFNEFTQWLVTGWTGLERCWFREFTVMLHDGWLQGGLVCRGAGLER